MNTEELNKQVITLEEKIDKLEKDSMRLEIVRNKDKIKEISKELRQKCEELSITKEILSVLSQLSDAQELILNEDDEGMKTLAQEEITKLEKRKQELETKLTQQKQGPQTADSKECILEIRAGTGGEESNLFASDLFRMYAKYAESKGWKVEILSKHESGTGGFKEIIAQISGSEAYSKLQYESGVHRVQRVPVTESSGRIHTSAVSVVIYPLLKETEINIKPEEIKYDVYRSTGPGGQSVNTTDSAVRITHLPTGLVVTCQDEKSQHKNKKKALFILASRLADMEAQTQREKVDEIRRTAIKTGDRSAKIRTYNFPQNRVTDHRIKKSWHNLKEIIEGNLEKIVAELNKTKSPQ